ncbi:hypothetical protein E2C01_046777 [Portunus trituberculatus]|uniref:Uncharacterized protein n=1 Tax=Portunus trituberculatus TaxID=210409 RepID=A0A5B7G5M8_PORTR|nr:hypothetical protein [Portunus trituberculatus]
METWGGAWAEPHAAAAAAGIISPQKQTVPHDRSVEEEECEIPLGIVILVTRRFVYMHLTPPPSTPAASPHPHSPFPYNRTKQTSTSGIPLPPSMSFGFPGANGTQWDLP